MATTQNTVTSEAPTRIVLRDVPWAAYDALRDASANKHVRMTYLDGTLELMSPEYVHEMGGQRLTMLVRAVARAFAIPALGVGSTTFRRPLEGAGFEADTAFYFGAHAAHVVQKQTIDLGVDPPPDLAIEVDNSVNTRWKLRVYARLLVPEVWRHDVQAGSLWFGNLGARRTYEPLERSIALPMLSPPSVLEVLRRGEVLLDEPYAELLEAWIRDELNPPR